MLKLKQAPALYVGMPEWFEKIWGNDRERIDSHKAGLDHLRYWKNLFICQPYGADGEDLLRFLIFCKEHNLAVKFTGVSNRYPSVTFTIIVYRPQDEADFIEFLSRIRTSEIVVPSGKDLFGGAQ